MSDLETKRNSIMNAVASGQLTNLLTDATWVEGYLNINGGVNAQSDTNLEMTSDYIEIDINTIQNITAIAKTTSNKNLWIAICFYKADKTHIGRNNIDYSGYIDQTLATFFQPIRNNAKYVRVSFRTFGNIDVALIPNVDLTTQTTTVNLDGSVN